MYVLRVTCVVWQVENVIKYISEARGGYISRNKGSFKNKKIIDRYRSDWVANYEISDYLRQQVMCESVHFVRYNQWPERNGATYEEKERLVEEKVFGGKVCGDKVSVSLEEGASRFIVESFHPSRRLYRPEDWIKINAQKTTESKESRDSPINHRPQIFVLDLNGHFACCFSCVVAKSSNSKKSGVEQVRVLIVINTTSASYLSAGAPCAAFDLAFPPA